MNISENGDFTILPIFFAIFKIIPWNKKQIKDNQLLNKTSSKKVIKNI